MSPTDEAFSGAAVCLLAVVLAQGALQFPLFRHSVGSESHAGSLLIYGLPAFAAFSANVGILMRFAHVRITSALFGALVLTGLGYYFSAVASMRVYNNH